MLTEPAGCWTNSRKARRKPIKILIARKLRPRETEVARSTHTVMLAEVRKIVIMIANIMTTSIMTNVIMITVDTIIMKTSILADMTRIMIIARSLMGIRTIMTRIARKLVF